MRLPSRKIKILFFICVLVYLCLIIVKMQSREVQSVEDFTKTNEFLNSTINTTLSLNLTCPQPVLRGHLGVIDLDDTSLHLSMSVRFGGEVEYGGRWKPKNCTARKKVAFLVPFRNRSKQLNVFLRHMHPIFQRQLLEYRIFVIEQVRRINVSSHIYKLHLPYIYKLAGLDEAVFISSRI